MPTIPLYFHHVLTLADPTDRPDAPAGAASTFVTHIVFKLFIEISQLTPLANAASAHYTDPQTITFDDLTSFLTGAGFDFHLRSTHDIDVKKPPVLAPFPMLPYVTLAPPTPDSAVDFSTHKPCSQQFLDSLTDPFAVPLPPQTPAAIPAAPRTFPSLAAGLFTDYFITLAKHLQDQNDVTAAAKAAGLFLMHSIRLRDPESPGARDYPLYVLSGQQLPVDTSKQYAVTLSQSAGATVTVTFANDGKYKFTFNTIPAAFDPASRIVALTQSEPFAVSKRRFALSDPVPTPSSRIYALPQSLRDQMSATPVPNGLDLTLLLRDGTPASGFKWATRVSFTIRQTPDPSAAGKTLANIYEIVGMDTDSRDDLLSFLLSPGAAAGTFNTSLLYAAPTQGATADTLAVGEVFLIKSNLSTQSHNAADPASSSADITQGIGFLTLLWESSLFSTGGFYLYYGHGAGLPSTVFGQTGTATVRALIQPQPKIAAQPFHNCVVARLTDDSAFIDPPVYTVAAGDTLASIAATLQTTVEDLVFANATDTAILNAPPTENLLSLALRNEAQPYGTQTLHALWTALLAAPPDLQPGASLQMPGWTAARAATPPGAVGYRALANLPPDPCQKLYSFLNVPGGRAAGPQGTPPFYRQILYLGDANPYKPIGQTAPLAVNYQDVFGNSFRPVSPALARQFQIGYRDPLAGLGQWPGTTVSYDFASGPQFVFTIAFSTARYVPAAGESLDVALKRAAFDRTRYITIAQQIGQPGIGFTVGSTLTGDAAANADLLKTCRAHVDAVRTFLTAVTGSQKTMSAVTSAELATLAAANGVLVEDLASVNQNLANLLNGQMRQLQIPQQYVVNQNETLDGIASRHNATVDQLTALNPKAGPSPAPGTLLTVGVVMYNLQAGDTFASIAASQAVTVALIATANQTAAILNTADSTLQVEIPAKLTPADFPAVTVSVPVKAAVSGTVTPVRVSIAISRPAGSVDVLFSDAAQFPGVQAIETEIRPAAGTLEKSDALNAFAGSFESAFGLKLALGPDQAGTPQVSDAKRLYAVQLQGLVQLDIHARFFAPPPLLNTGWTGSIAQGGTTFSFANADIDAWAREFVTTLDLMLSPAYAAGLHASLHSDIYHTLASAKDTIAGAMSASVIPILAGTTASAVELAAAQDTLFERVLVQLQEFYKVDAIVQFTATTAFKPAGSARLSGNLQAAGVALSGTDIDLTQSASELTFALHLANPAQFSDLQFAPSFDPVAIELESFFQGGALAPGYEAFDQLVLLPVSPNGASAFAKADVPIPLRAYPPPPSLTSQAAVQDLPTPATLADLQKYEYRFSFNYALASQDYFHVALTTVPAALAAASGSDDLPEQLAHWSVFASTGSPALAGLLQSPPTPDSVTAAAAFATLATAVATAWNTRTATVAQGAIPPPLPAGSQVTQQDDAATNDHTVTVGPLDVIRVQSIQGSLEVTRNEKLGAQDASAHAAFIYRLPPVQFTKPVAPLFRDDNPVDIATLPAPAFLKLADPLRQHIAVMIANLLDADAATPADGLPNLRIAISFEFALAGTLLTRTPVSLLPRFAFDPSVDFLADTGVCARIATELTNWHTREASGPGTFVFDVSLYSTVNPDSIQPLLELTNLRAAMS